MLKDGVIAEDVAIEAPRAAWISPAFWLIAANLFCMAFLLSAFMTHGVALLTERGLSRETATGALSFFSIGMTLAQPLLGYLLDRFASPRIVLPFAASCLLGLALFQIAAGAGAVPIILLIGLGCGESGTTQYTVSRYFGLRHFSLIYGSPQPFTGLASAAGPLLVGLLYDRTGSYREDLMLLTLAALLSSGALLLLKRYPSEFPEH